MRNYYNSARKGILCALFFAFPMYQDAFSQPTIVYNPVIATGLSSPVDLVNAADGSNRVFIVEQGGAIKVYTSSFTFIGTFLTVTGVATGGEQGLLSMAFDPDYESTNPAIGGFFYVYYTNTNGDLELARYHVSSNPNVADAATKTVVMTIPHPANSNHNGAKLLFGADGYLYFATGDGGSAGDPPNNAQNPGVLLGKMLRINVTNSASPPYYTIPADNPYVGAGNPLDEIWALGLRNPFRWSFDRLTQGMWIGDVGQGQREEINYRPAATSAGVNYGWRCYEGNLPYNTTGCSPASNYTFPVYDYARTGGGPASVTGGVVYRGSIYSSLYGFYIAADVYSGTVYLINSTQLTTTVQIGLPNFIVCFGESENGEVYAVSLTGIIYHVESVITAPLPVTLVGFTGVSTSGITTLHWKTATEERLQQFNVEFSTDGVNYSPVGIVQARNDVNGSTYSFDHPASGTPLFYRLKMVDSDGRFTYSPVLRIENNFETENFINPSVITTGIITMQLDEGWQTADLVSSNGVLVLRRNLHGQTGRVDIPISRVTGGVYMMVLRNRERQVSQKIIIRQ